MSVISQEYFDGIAKAFERFFQIEIDLFAKMTEPTEKDRQIMGLYTLNQLRVLFMLDKRFKRHTPSLSPRVIINSTLHWHDTFPIHQFTVYSVLFGIQTTDLFSEIRNNLHDNLDINLSHLNQNNYCDFFESTRKFSDRSIKRTGVATSNLHFVDQWVVSVQGLFDNLRLEPRSAFC